MQVELNRIAPLRAANVLSLLHAVSVLRFAVPMFLMASLMPVAGVSAFFCNVIAGWIGGLHFEYQPGLDGTSTRAA